MGVAVEVYMDGKGRNLLIIVGNTIITMSNQADLRG